MGYECSSDSPDLRRETEDRARTRRNIIAVSLNQLFIMKCSTLICLGISDLSGDKEPSDEMPWYGDGVRRVSGRNSLSYAIMFHS